jgi:3-oxoadipate enol-lactonase
MRVSANGIGFNCRIEGPEGAPWVAFSNSLATNLTLWDAQAAALARRFRVLRYDQRGHGGSDAPAGRYDFDLLIADLVALFDALDVPSAHIVGISMGGMTALGLAQRHPARVRSIAACDCGPGSTPASAAQWEERIALARAQGMVPLVEQTVGRWFPAPALAANDPAVDTAREMVRTTPVDGFVGCAAALASFDFRPGLGTIACPALVVVGGEDAALPGARQIAGAIPGAELVVLEGAGHLSNLEQPAAFTQALERFLEKA